MKDNDIIKAVECCYANNCICSKCPWGDTEIPCDEKLAEACLSLLKRQQAELAEKDEVIKAQADKIFLYERALTNKTAEIERYKGVIKLLEKDVRTAKTEAVKEFAEKVKPILREMFSLMIDDDEGKCIIEDCKKHSSISCMNEYCIKENLIAWETKIDNLVKEMTEGNG